MSVPGRVCALAAEACAIAAALCLVSYRPEPAAAPPPANSAPAASASAASTEGTAPHGDHNPHHGGVVLMKGDLHYEVVLDPTGRAHHVYFTDAVREALPASVASEVMLTIRRPLRPGSGQASPEERVTLQIDETGESWVGSGHPVATPATATARLAFSIDREPYWIDIPFTAPETSRQ
jgi:hypothetical protein